MIKSKAVNKGLDVEWLQLILEAKKLGIQKEEIREFLKKSKLQE